MTRMETENYADNGLAMNLLISATVSRAALAAPMSHRERTINFGNFRHTNAGCTNTDESYTCNISETGEGFTDKHRQIR